MALLKEETGTAENKLLQLQSVQRVDLNQGGAKEPHTKEWWFIMKFKKLAKLVFRNVYLLAELQKGTK